VNKRLDQISPVPSTHQTQAAAETEYEKKKKKY
jgi:hypothetical protein